MAKNPKYITDTKAYKVEYERVVTLRKELATSKAELQELIDILKSNANLPEEVELHISELTDELNRIESLYNTTTTYIEEIKNFKDQFDTIKDSIESELATASEKNTTINSYVEELDKLKTELSEEADRSKTLLDDARETLQLITDGSLSTVFIKRSSELKDSRNRWIKGIVVYFIFFVSTIFFIIERVAGDVGLQGSIGAWTLKLAVSAPFIYFLYFLTKQYSHERDLEEKYAFKALISQTINNNTKLLKDEFENSPGEKDPVVSSKILDFTIDSLKSVYREPFKESSLKSKLKVNPKNSAVSAEVERSESV